VNQQIGGFIDCDIMVVPVEYLKCHYVTVSRDPISSMTIKIKSELPLSFIAG
jgi:hypothetical protein